MRIGLIGLALVIATLACAAIVPAQQSQAPGALAQAPAGLHQTAKNIPYLSGIWNRSANRNADGVFDDDATGVPFLGFSKQEPALQPTALKTYEANRNGVSDPRAKGRDDSDPSSSCFPPGPTRIFTIPRPFEIRQTPQIVYIISEADHWVRRIYTDGRKQPDGYPTTWMGYSIGKYEGDTLVVDTTNMNEKTWIDALGHPHSEELHLMERIRRANRDSLEIAFTFDDPKTYAKPWTGKKIFQLQPAGYEIKEDIVCSEYRKLGLRTEGYEFIKP